jgi:hypothetical protein
LRLPPQRQTAIKEAVIQAAGDCSKHGNWPLHLRQLQKQLQGWGLPQSLQAGLLLAVIAELEAQLHKSCSALPPSFPPPIPTASPGSRARGSSSSGGGGDGNNPLADMPVTQAVGILMDALGETGSPNKGLPVMYAKRIQELGPAAVWQICLEAQEAHKAGDDTVVEPYRTTQQL